jgi:Phage integrase, N-terminal SAM-like domain/Arm DNA-binding domain
MSLQGSFVRKRGKTWTLYYYVEALGGGRRQRTKGGFHTKAEAQESLKTLLSAVQRGEYVESSKLTVREYLIDRWLPMMRTQVRPTTWDSYRRNLEIHVIPRIGQIALQQLAPDHLDDLYAELLSNGRVGRSETRTGLSPKSVRYIHSTLHKALKDAERKRLVTRNVASAADPPKLRAGDKEMKTWTPEQVLVLLQAMKGSRSGSWLHPGCDHWDEARRGPRS